MTHGPLSVVHHIRLQRPVLLVLYIWIHVLNGDSDAPTIGKGERPEIIPGGGKDLANGCHGIEIEKRIAVRLGATQLLRKSSVSGNLIRYQNCLETVATKGHQFLVAD